MKVGIVGDGVFGSFLRSEILRVAPEMLVNIEHADTLLLAVPSHAYDSVARDCRAAHLVNVCSVQFKTNQACQRWSPHVTGIHPLFGPRSGMEGRTAAVTLKCDQSAPVLELFQKMGASLVDLDGDGGWRHDEMMSKTHVEVVRLQAKIRSILERAHGVPDELCPTSFRRLRTFAQTFQDMPEGTLSSILDNPCIGSDED